MRRVVRGKPLLVVAVTAGVAACGTSDAIDGGGRDSTTVNDAGPVRSDTGPVDAHMLDSAIVNDGGSFDAPMEDAPRPDATSVNDGGSFLDAPVTPPDEDASSGSSGDGT